MFYSRNSEVPLVGELWLIPHISLAAILSVIRKYSSSAVHCSLRSGSAESVARRKKIKGHQDSWDKLFFFLFCFFN